MAVVFAVACTAGLNLILPSSCGKTTSKKLKQKA
jgi:hypothetical protein